MCFWDIFVIMLLKQCVWRRGCCVYGAYGDWGMWFPRALPLKLQAYTVSIPRYWDSPLLSVTALNNGVTLLFLVKWKHVYLYEKTTGLSLWRKTLSSSVCPRAVKMWNIMKNEKNVLKYVLKLKEDDAWCCHSYWLITEIICSLHPVYAGLS